MAMLKSPVVATRSGNTLDVTPYEYSGPPLNTSTAASGRRRMLGEEQRGTLHAWELYAAPQWTYVPEERLWADLRDALQTDLSEGEIGMLATDTIEPLVDLYWPQALDELCALADNDARVRAAIGACWFANAVPDDILARLDRYKD